MLAVLRFGQHAAEGADKNIVGVAAVFCQEVTGEEVEPGAAMVAVPLLNPEEVFCMGVGGAALQAGRPVEVAYTVFKLTCNVGCGYSVGIEIEMFDFSANNPVGHGIDVETDDVTSKSICFHEGSAAPHERIGDCDAVELVGCVECVGEWLFNEFGEDQPPEESSRTAGEPLVDGNDWTVVLLNLLLAKSKV